MEFAKLFGCILPLIAGIIFANEKERHNKLLVIMFSCLRDNAVMFAFIFAKA